MKVLIIAESEKTVTSLKALFKTQTGYEIISYRQLIKAMDNVEEISPTIIVISAVDFPRHWKVFMQYVNSVFSSLICDIVLIVDSKFDDIEKQKAETLGVWRTLNETKLNKYGASAIAGTVDFIEIVKEEETNAVPKAAHPEPSKEIQEKLKSIMAPAETQDDGLDEIEDQFEEALREQERILEQERAAAAAIRAKDAPHDAENVQLLFQHPKTGFLVTGHVEQASDKTIIFKPDDKNALGTFANGQVISSASYKNGESLRIINAAVRLRENALELAIERKAV
jgi:hypothetical protein